MKDYLIKQIRYLKKGIMQDKKIRNFWIFGSLLIIGSFIASMYTLILVLIPLILFLTYGNISTYNQELRQEKQEIIEEIGRLKMIHKELVSHAEENNLTLEEKRELTELEIEIKNLENILKEIEKEEIN